MDVLELREGYFEPGSSYSEQTSKTLFEFLNQLHEQGFYKRLHIFGVADDYSTKLALIKIHEFLSMGCHFREIYNLDQLTKLRELMIRAPHGKAKDMEILANSLTQLDRLCIIVENIDVVMPFIRRSLKLNKIKFLSTSWRAVPLNLAMLNEERACI